MASQSETHTLTEPARYITHGAAIDTLRHHPTHHLSIPGLQTCVTHRATSPNPQPPTPNPQPKTRDTHTNWISIDTLRTHTASQSEAHTIAVASESWPNTMAGEWGVGSGEWGVGLARAGLTPRGSLARASKLTPSIWERAAARTQGTSEPEPAVNGVRLYKSGGILSLRVRRLA